MQRLSLSTVIGSFALIIFNGIVCLLSARYQGSCFLLQLSFLPSRNQTLHRNPDRPHNSQLPEPLLLFLFPGAAFAENSASCACSQSVFPANLRTSLKRIRRNLKERAAVWFFCDRNSIT